MLPAHRIIGHKEYAAGRKSDPQYDMNWRRNRVAGFVPRGTVMPGAPAVPSLEEDDVMLIMCQYTKDLQLFGLWSGGILIGLSGPERKGFDQQVAAGATVIWVNPGTWDLMDRRGQMLTGEKLGPAQQQLLDAVKALAPAAKA